jgi:hypothetical protein
VIPVVGDGKWIWTKPPDGQTGYLEPRPYELSIGMELTGQGEATQIRASTPVPLAFPEQEVGDASMTTEGCQASIQRIGEGAAQLLLAAAGISRGQRIRALARYRLILKEQYLGYERDRFPTAQPAPPPTVRKQYLGDSPGIQTRAPELRKLHDKLAGQLQHPWDKAAIFQWWVQEESRRSAVRSSAWSMHFSGDTAIAKKKRPSSWRCAGPPTFRRASCGFPTTTGLSFI